MNVIRLLFAFSKRDFLIESSYRLNFVTHICGMIFQLLIFYYISKLVTPDANAIFDGYQGGYFPFVLVGIALSGYLGWALTSLSAGIRNEQLMGTLEPVLQSPLSNTQFIAGEYTSSFLYATLEAVLYLLIGSLFLSANLSVSSAASLALTILLAVSSLAPLGILSASFIIYFKKGDLINLVLIYVFQLFGGVYFPQSILPAYLQKICYFFPITHLLELARGTLIYGKPFGAVLPNILFLLIFSVILLPVSLICFNYALKKAKIVASLSHY